MEGKSGSITIYPLVVLDDPSNIIKPVKLEETAGSTMFRVGTIKSEVKLIIFSSKILVYTFQYSTDSFIKVTVILFLLFILLLFLTMIFKEIQPPNLFCRSIEFGMNTIQFALGSRFYTLNPFQPKQLTEIDTSFEILESNAITSFDLYGSTFYCFSGLCFFFFRKKKK